MLHSDISPKKHDMGNMTVRCVSPDLCFPNSLIFVPSHCRTSAQSYGQRLMNNGMNLWNIRKMREKMVRSFNRES
jgi:hypothetical protein